MRNTTDSWITDADWSRAARIYWLLTLVVGLWLLWDAVFFRLGSFPMASDYWEHSATLTEWLRNLGSPTNPHVASDDLGPRYMPWFWVLTVIGIVFGLDAVDLMGISAVASYGLIITGMHLFMRDYFRNPWAPLAAWLAIFICWGVSWNWSNLYQLRSFFYVAGFPSSFCFGLSLIAFWVTLRYLRGELSTVTGVAWIALLAALMFLVHPLTGVFGMAGCGLLAITESRAAWDTRVVSLLSILLGMALAELWPYFSPLKLTLGLYGASPEKWFVAAESVGMLERFRSGAWAQIFYDRRLVLIMFGPALLGIPLCLWLLAQRKHLFIGLGALLMSVPYLANFFVEIPLAHRFLLFLVVFLHMAIAWFTLACMRFWRTQSGHRLARPAQLATLLFWSGLGVANVALLAMEYSGYTLDPKTLSVRDKHGRNPERVSAVALYTRLTAPLPDDAVVMSTPYLGWVLPTVKGKTIALYHENPMLLDQLERQDAVRRFHSEPLGAAERQRIVQQYRVSHVLMSEGEQGLLPEVWQWLEHHARVVVRVERFVMYELLPSASPVAQRTGLTPGAQCALARALSAVHRCIAALDAARCAAA